MRQRASTRVKKVTIDRALVRLVARDLGCSRVKARRVIENAALGALTVVGKKAR
jgi:hypothetical protein